MVTTARWWAVSVCWGTSSPAPGFSHLDITGQAARIEAVWNMDSFRNVTIFRWCCPTSRKCFVWCAMNYRKMQLKVLLFIEPRFVYIRCEPLYWLSCRQGFHSERYFIDWLWIKYRSKSDFKTVFSIMNFSFSFKLFWTNRVSFSFNFYETRRFGPLQGSTSSAC